MRSAALEWLDGINSRHPWSHNDLHAPLVLLHARRVRAAGGTRAVDVGCGSGHLLRRLARVMPSVVGVEADAGAAALAAHSVAGLPGVEVRHETFDGLPEQSVDLLTLVAVLHHLPLVDTLATVRLALRPRGRLVVIGCYREVLADGVLSLVSPVLNPLVGLLVHPRSATGTPPHLSAPTTAPQEAFEEITDVVRAELPGIRIHRSLFWRYVAVWTAPDPPGVAGEGG